MRKGIKYAIWATSIFLLLAPMKIVNATESFQTDTDLNIDKALKAYNKITTPKREVVIAIVDTGVDFTHPALKDSIWINEGEIPDDGIDNDNNGYIDDYYGWDFYNNKPLEPGSYFGKDNNIHGTHCAGIITANDEKAGVIGIAAKTGAKIMILKTLGCNGDSPKGTGSIEQSAEAIRYATAMGADICNISWITPTYNKELEDAIRISPMLFVVAAGNNSYNLNEKNVYPASFKLDNIISVASVDNEGALSTKSNYGSNTVDIAAPGEEIYSTGANGEYVYMSGTSMAAPHVAGVAAILYSLNDSLYAKNVKDILIESGKQLSFAQGYIKNPVCVNAYNAVKSVSKLTPDKVKPTLTVKYNQNKNKIKISIKSDDKGGSYLRTVRYMKGKKTAKDFIHGTKGTEILKSFINITKAGTYTFYATDYAGNEKVVTKTIKGDTSPPTLNVSSIIKVRSGKKIIFTATDNDSGVAKIKFLSGTRKESSFKKGGKNLELKNNKGFFTVTKNGTYTIYAEDYQGNTTLKYVTIK